MSRITSAIPNQNFELVRDRIAEILIDELDNQVVNFYDTDLEVDVYVERTVPFDKVEMPCINVSLARDIFDNKNPLATDGTCTFNIDGYTAAKSNEVSQGDSRAAVKLQRILGVCRAILENPAYNTLGFSKPKISRVSCGEISIAEPNRQDALHTMMGRLTLIVRVPETTQLIIPELIEGYETEVKIGTTEVGYAYVTEVEGE